MADAPATTPPAAATPPRADDATVTVPPSPGAWHAYRRLLPVMLADFRTTGPFHAFLGILLPAGILFFVQTTGTDTSDPRYLAAGALAATLALGPAVMLCARLGLAREQREFDYWATLPVPKVSFVLALCTANLLFALPGVAVMLAIGVGVLGVAWSGAVAALPLIPLSTVALAGVGAALGSRAPSAIVGNLIGNLLLAVVLFLSPLMTRVDAYPQLLRPVVYAVPTTYVADAFRHVLDGGPTLLPFAVDVAVLVALAIALPVLTHRLLDWRSR